MEKYMLALLVQNKSGVLARVSSLFGRRGYNIDSLTVSTTENPEISHITIVVQGDEDILQQIMKQAAKLEECMHVCEYGKDTAIVRELLLVKMSLVGDDLSMLRQIAEIYEAKIIDLTAATMTMELTGTPLKIDSFLEIMKTHKIIELCRTGATAMERGLLTTREGGRTGNGAR
ncbi:MAG TPA: acetolactate synthase small subunit [Terriglobales bacterium]|nr:acetolactate synthase small subunit [Terriglobales bacterium]